MVVAVVGAVFQVYLPKTVFVFYFAETLCISRSMYANSAINIEAAYLFANLFNLFSLSSTLSRVVSLVVVVVVVVGFFNFNTIICVMRSHTVLQQTRHLIHAINDFPFV